MVLYSLVLFLNIHLVSITFTFLGLGVKSHTSLLTNCTGGIVSITTTFNDPHDLYGNSIATISITVIGTCTVSAYLSGQLIGKLRCGCLAKCAHGATSKTLGAESQRESMSRKVSSDLTVVSLAVVTDRKCFFARSR